MPCALKPCVRVQVFKGGLSRSGTEEGVQFRYFAQQELRDLFTISGPAMEASETQATLEKLHGGQRHATPETVEHLRLLEGLPGFTGAHRSCCWSTGYAV